MAVGVTTTPPLTAGEIADRTGVAYQQYRMVGIRDALRAYRDPPGNVQLLMNQELTQPVNSEPVVNAGPFVSQFTLSPTDGGTISGDLAYRSIVKIRGRYRQGCFEIGVAKAGRFG